MQDRTTSFDDMMTGTDTAEFVGLEPFPQFFTYAVLGLFSILRHLEVFVMKITIIGLFEIQD